MTSTDKFFVVVSSWHASWSQKLSPQEVLIPEKISDCEEWPEPSELPPLLQQNGNLKEEPNLFFFLKGQNQRLKFLLGVLICELHESSHV
ncbi:unnamed protein product [Brassica rapa subsp. trilocularis]